MNNKTKAVLYMLLSALGFAFMGAMVKLAGNLPVIEKVFFRNFISLFVAFGALKKTTGPILGKRENQKYLLARALLGLTGMFLYFYSIDHLKLADSAMLNKLSPFFITLFAIMFLKEELTSMKVVSMIIVFMGALLVIKPQWDLSIIPAIAGFLSAAFAGGAYTLVRFLKDRENPSTIVFYFSLVSVLGAFPFMAMNFIMPTKIQFLYLILTGVFAAIAQFSLTYSYKYAPASEVAIYNYVNIVFSGIIGFFIWNEIPDKLSILGGVIILVMATIVYFYNKKR
ncbi:MULTISPECIES: DMT family transporter [Clostridium]|uniref:Transporter n=1 Tax=Clostridium novyi (strain NT) TaxID=386415 RepID=A0Q3A2_CLONN|nr:MULTISPECIES: DMT family transporter [Clostridium]ABK61668.1 Transporter [Clostridium novyi NT]KEH86556.1 membrane protein [Clostridium novyi A str. 4540]KEH87376.1 membrane protein [Clostridium novyi A str. BKT29909]KEH87560.1 membrane protein [Clostridium novyi A str. NCTC 538]KEH90914.1 membrane protein [Clostridium botulinum C/D str. It1]